jgi:peptidyl-tRNA hydrolase
VIQRDEDGGMDLSQTAVVAGAVAVGTAAKVMESSSSLKTDVDVYKDISKKKGTMEVFVRVQKPQYQSTPEQQMADMADDSEGIPEFTRTLIAKHIETILRQDPRREVVEKKLPEVALKFDLDLVKIAGYTEIGGSSFEYKVLAQGNPKAVAQKKIEDMLKKMAKMGSAQGQPSAPQQDGTTELPPKPPEPEATKDKSKSTESKDESGKTPDTEDRDQPTPSTLESQKAKTTKVKATGTPDGADTASAKPLSTKTQIKPGGDPKTLFVIARVDPEDKK